MYKTVSDLPSTLAVFPLAGSLLFPRWSLPINVFEPRYVHMVDDALSSNRVIGVVQTVGGEADRPNLARIGCAGRITSYAEVNDGRRLIVLIGISRFTIRKEIANSLPYRQINPDWDMHATDLGPVTEADLPSRDNLSVALKRYTQTNTMEVDWDAVAHAPMETLVNALCTGCPFGDVEKQALIEAPTLHDRALTLMTLLDMNMHGDNVLTLQ